MTDLRTGLVEAATDAILDVVYLGASRTELGTTQIRMHELAAEAALDRMLGFLTDNAEAWIRAAHDAGDLDDGMHRGDHALVDPLIAALSDSRDTGDSP